jgi:hypothetical protein
MVVNVRTRDDLRVLLGQRASGNWIIGVNRVPQITKVRVFNWDSNQVLKGDFDLGRSIRANGRLTIGMSHCRIENFSAQERWPEIFGAAVVVYTPIVSVQRLFGQTIGILRTNLVGLNNNEIDEIFRGLLAEIRLRGINRIVIRSGNIPIPDFFEEWCNINNVNIEILSEEEMDDLYPVQNDNVFEDNLFDIFMNFEVAQNDLPMLCTWEFAFEQQVNGWRLPTIVELQNMHDILHLNGQGNFVTDNADNNEVYYWSSADHEDYEDAAWAFNFGNYQGDALGIAPKAKGIPRRVRLVRDL